jgi:hypothetical protein
MLMNTLIKAPLLQAQMTSSGSAVRVWCAHCRRYHQHGAAGIVDGSNPHRLAHCHKPGSPYETAGYILQLAQEGRA